MCASSFMSETLADVGIPVVRVGLDGLGRAEARPDFGRAHQALHLRSGSLTLELEAEQLVIPFLQLVGALLHEVLGDQLPILVVERTQFHHLPIFFLGKHLVLEFCWFGVRSLQQATTGLLKFELARAGCSAGRGLVV